MFTTFTLLPVHMRLSVNSSPQLLHTVNFVKQGHVALNSKTVTGDCLPSMAILIISSNLPCECCFLPPFANLRYMNFHPQCSVYSIINNITVTFRSQDSAVGSRGWKIKSSNPAMDKNYINSRTSRENIRTGTKAHFTSYLLGAKGYFLEGKWPGCEAYQLPSSTAKI